MRACVSAWGCGSHALSALSLSFSGSTSLGDAFTAEGSVRERVSARGRMEDIVRVKVTIGEA